MKRFGTVVALDGIDLSVDAATILALLGMLRSGFPDVQWTLEDTVSDGDKVAASARQAQGFGLAVEVWQISGRSTELAMPEPLPPEPPVDAEARTTLESEVARLTDQIEKIGPVNVLAIEEHQELEQRESFLRTQRDDLVQAIESLRGTIRKINLTARELFREAFTAVNQSFTEIFMSLFGGGTARMQLLDEEDILESGIELVAQPPGKRNQSIALLSGGERALTALALLFAIFRYKPSPFCILDEVDAPLDEVNNERFVRLVRDMSRDTQFIVITHSRRTMEAADILYGVTMEEAGCSRLVSVNFAEMEG